MNARKNNKHTRKGIEMIRKLSEEGKQIFTVSDAKKIAPFCEISEQYVNEALYYLAKDGWIKRLKRGLYLISSSFPGIVPAHEFEIAMFLVEPAAISYWSAIHFHGMTEQIPNKVYITTSGNISAERKINSQNNNLKGFSRKINNIIYVFIKVKPERFFGVKEYWVGEKKVTITNPERTLIDGLVSPRYFGGWAEIYNAFELHASRVNINKLISYAMRLDASVVKRLGWILEKNGVEEKKLQKLIAFPIKGYRILDSSGFQTGPYNKKWMIRENISVKGMK